MTIKDIAKLAGVSTSTISRILNNSGYVKQEVREKVEAIIEETGYTPSAVAKNLKKQGTDVIGVIIPKLNSSSISLLVDGINEVLNSHKLSLLLGNAENSPQKELELLNLFHEKRVQGIILLASELTLRHQKILSKFPIPVVLAGQCGKDIGISSVIQQETKALERITDKVIEKGHRRIGFIGVHESDEAVGLKRKQGYLNSMIGHGLEVENSLIHLGGFSYDTALEGTKKLVAQNVTAIVVATDTLAVKVIETLRKLGKKVPEDISVTGAGNSEMGAMYFPTLTTIHFDYRNTGKTAATLLVDQLQENSGCRTIEMDYSLILRESLK